MSMKKKNYNSSDLDLSELSIDRSNSKLSSKLNGSKFSGADVGRALCIDVGYTSVTGLCE
jgi:hypothetical protein